MAGRNIKEGLDYFKLDVNYGTDDAIELIDSEFGPPGFRIMVKLLQRIYGKKGYYIEWNEKRRILFASSVKEKAGLIDEVVARSIKWGFFNESVFNKFGILTSADIQFTYLDAAKRREKVEIIREYSLCDIAAFENAICVNINAICDTGNTQSRVKESRVKESKENTGAPPAPSTQQNGITREKKKFNPPSEEEVANYFLSTIGHQDHPKHWPEDKCRNQAALFLDHYTANGWVQGRGKPIKDWQAACRNWIRHGLQGIFDKPEPAAREKEQQPRRRTEDQGPQLTKIQEEINYLYEHWLEKPEEVTVISVQADHYNYLKKTGGIDFSEEQVQKIKKVTLEYMTDKGLTGDPAMMQVMKKHGVLYFFTQLKAQGKETVFHDQK